jgi:hypothetical protein
MPFDVPDVVSVGSAATLGAWTLAAEFRMADYGILSDYHLAAPDYATPIDSTRWQVEPRAGAQVRLPAGASWNVVVSGGAAREAPAGLEWGSLGGYAKQQRWRTVQTGLVRFSGGLSVETSKGDIGIAFSRASDERRLIVTFGRRFP